MLKPVTCSKLLVMSVRSENMLQRANYELVHYHPREATGRNDGPRVEHYLSRVGLGKGYPWCAAFMFTIARDGGVYEAKELPSHGASVFGWKQWAANADEEMSHRTGQYLISTEAEKVSRSDLFFWLNSSNQG